MTPSSDNCLLCSAPLLDADTGLPDSVVLPCGHSFHYACIEDEYLNYEFPSSSSSSTSAAAPTPTSASTPNRFPCPSCQTIHGPQLLATLTNEGGVQHNFNLGAHLAEEAFYDSRPHLKRRRAFLAFCAEGDLESCAGMLEAGEDDDEEEEEEEEDKDDDKTPLVDTTDPESGESALHVAAGNGKWEVVRWLLVNGASLERVDGAGRGVLDVVRAMAGEEGVKEVLEVASAAAAGRS